MKCEEMQSNLTLYLLGDLSEDDRALVESHLDTCSVCQAIVQELKPTLDLLGVALAGTSCAPERLAPEHVEGITSAFQVPEKPREPWFMQGHPKLALAASLTFIVGLCCLLISQMKPSKSPRVTLDKAEEAIRSNDAAGSLLEDLDAPAADKPLDSPAPHDVEKNAPEHQAVGEPVLAENEEETFAGSMQPPASAPNVDSVDSVSPGRDAGKVLGVIPEAEPARRDTVVREEPEMGTLNEGLRKGVVRPDLNSREPPPPVIKRSSARAKIKSTGIAQELSVVEDRSGPSDEFAEVSSGSLTFSATVSPAGLADKRSSRDFAREHQARVQRKSREYEWSKDAALSPRLATIEPAERMAEKKAQSGAMKAPAPGGSYRESIGLKMEAGRSLDLEASREQIVSQDNVGRDKKAVAKTGNVVAGSEVERKELARAYDDGVSLDEARKREAMEFNPFYGAGERPSLTLSMDVGAASYSVVRNYLNRGAMPPPETVRTEELLNSFDYGYKAAAKDAFSIFTECAPSRFGRGLYLLKVGVNGRAPAEDDDSRFSAIESDVEIQVQFNPEQIKRYRQIGYETCRNTGKALADSVGSGGTRQGRSLTALYEVELMEGAKENRTDAEQLATVRVRYKQANSGDAEEVTCGVEMDAVMGRFDNMPAHFRLAAAVAEFAELLRGSPHAVGSDFEMVEEVLAPVAMELNKDKEVRELLRLVESAKKISRAAQ